MRVQRLAQRRRRCRGRRSPTRRRTAATSLPALARALRGEIAHQRLRHRQPDRALRRTRRLLRSSCVAPAATRRSAPRNSPRACVDQPRVVDAAGEPRARGLGEQRAADGEAAARCAMPPRCGESLHQLRRPARSAPAARRRGNTGRARRSAHRRAGHCVGGHRRQLPPFRVDAEVVEPLHRAQQRCRPQLRQLLRRDRSRSAARGRSPARRRRARCSCASCSSRIVDRVVGMERHQALDDVLDAASSTSVVPIDRPCSNSSGFDARQFDRPPDPPAAARRRVERVLAVAIVDQHADAALQSARCFGLARPRRPAAASAPECALVGAGFARQLEELRRDGRRRTMKSSGRGVRGAVTRCSRVSVASRSGCGIARGVGEEIVELDARGHRRRAAVARHDERAAGVGVAAAGVVVLAAQPARQEARR